MQLNSHIKNLREHVAKVADTRRLNSGVFAVGLSGNSELKSVRRVTAYVRPLGMANISHALICRKAQTALCTARLLVFCIDMKQLEITSTQLHESG
jgi:hypothetical protein